MYFSLSDLNFTQHNYCYRWLSHHAIPRPTRFLFWDKSLGAPSKMVGMASGSSRGTPRFTYTCRNRTIAHYNHIYTGL